MDISNLIRAMDDETSPHEEVEEMERWRRMYDGYEFYDYMHDFKRMKREEVIMARRTETQFFTKMGGGSMSRCRAKMRDSMAARSLPPSGSIRTKVMIKTQTTEAGWWAERSNAISGWIFFSATPPLETQEGKVPRDRAGWPLLISKGPISTRRRADQPSLRYLRKTEKREKRT